MDSNAIQLGAIVVFIIGLFAWVRAIYERADAKREKLVTELEGLTMENVTLKNENADLKVARDEWRDLSRKYHKLAVKYYNLSQSMIVNIPTQPDTTTTITTTTPNTVIPTPDEVFNDERLAEELDK